MSFTKNGRRLDAVRKRRTRIEQNDEIDIAGIIQLARAELSHAEHDEARALAGNVGLGKTNLACRARFRQQKISRRLDRRLGDRSQGLRHFGEGPGAANVGERDQQRRLPFHQPQLAGDRFLIGGRTRRLRSARDQIGKMPLGIGIEEFGKTLRVFANEPPEEGRAVGDAFDQPAYRILFEKTL